MPQFYVIHGGSTLPRKPWQHFVKILAGEVLNAAKAAWYNLSSGGKVRNWRWLYRVLYNAMSKTVVGVAAPGLSMMAKPVLHRKYQMGHSWPGVFGQKVRMSGNIWFVFVGKPMITKSGLARVVNGAY